MQEFFTLVADSLIWVSQKTGFSYNEINIIVFYGFIPMAYAAMIDKIAGKHWVKAGYGAICLVTVLVTDFSEFCDAFFADNVAFLNGFAILGLNYVVASVVICVILPGIMFIILFYFSYWPVIKGKFIPVPPKRQSRVSQLSK